MRLASPRYHCAAVTVSFHFDLGKAPLPSWQGDKGYIFHYGLPHALCRLIEENHIVAAL